MRSPIAFLLALPLLTGCASLPYADAPSEAEAKSFTPSPGKGQVYVLRRRNIVAAAIQFEVLFDGISAGGLGPGTFVVLELPPGQHTVTARTAESVSTIELSVDAGRNYFVRQVLLPGLSAPRVKLVVLAEEEGRELISGYRLVRSSIP